MPKSDISYLHKRWLDILFFESFYYPLLRLYFNEDLFLVRPSHRIFERFQLQLVSKLGPLLGRTRQETSGMARSRVRQTGEMIGVAVNIGLVGNQLLTLGLPDVTVSNLQPFGVSL